MSFEDELKELISGIQSDRERQNRELVAFRDSWQQTKLNTVKLNPYLTGIYLRYIVRPMAKQKISVYRYTCERCEHEWIPRDTDNEPRVCPKCKSPYWNKPRQKKK